MRPPSNFIIDAIYGLADLNRFGIRDNRGIAGSCLFMNYVIWESTGAFKHGFESPEFQAQLKQYPPGTEVLAFMFQRVAVPGMCLGEPVASD
jgi:hypothetical protein